MSVIDLPKKSDESQADALVAEKAPFVESDREKAPKDSYSLVYLIFLLHGIGVLLPWNVFLTVGKDVSFIIIFFIL